MTNHLYSSYYNPYGMDIFSLDIQRSRDHGIPSYTDFKIFCDLKYISNFEDLREILIDGVSLYIFNIF